tara:strand:- start:2688 stop:5897 length:3210 start_codon:yes stop_codon:yes gene_type:complete
MAFQVSPGVNISEIDASSNVTAVATSIGGMVGQFSKGPVSEIVEISSEDELVAVFGEPNDTNYRSWFTASNFLSYSSSIKIVRVVDDNNATPANQARNALSGKVTASSTTAGTVQNFIGAAASPTTIIGSSAQSFAQTLDGAVTQLNLHSGIDLLAGTPDDATKQYLYPRFNVGSTALVVSGAVDATDVVQRNLSSNDLTITVGKIGAAGGLLPVGRYSLNSNDNVINLTDSIGNVSGNAGPVYVHSHDGADNTKITNVGTNPGTAIPDISVGGTMVLGSGFTYPLYTRFATAALADSSTYGGTGTVHGHTFAKYEVACSAVSAVLDVDGAMLSAGDTVTVEMSGVTSIAYVVTATSSGGTTTLVLHDAIDGGSVVSPATSDKINKVFFMPTGTSGAPAGAHAAASAPAETTIKPYANGKDEIKLSVAKRSKFTLAKSPGAHAVTNNLVTISGSFTTNDFAVTANSTTVSFLNNGAPETPSATALNDAALAIVTVPARKSFTLSPAIDVASGQTVDVTIDGVAVTQGSASAQYSVVENGSRMEFVTAPGDALAITATIKNKLANEFSYGENNVTNLLIKNSVSFGTDLGFGAAAADGHEFAAKSAGDWGDLLHVYLIDESSYDQFLTDQPIIAASLSGTPRADDATRDVAAIIPVGSEPVSQGISLVVVYNGVVVEVIEHMSKAGNGKASDGRLLYYVDQINNTSNWVFCINHPSSVSDWGQNINVNGTSLNPVKTGFGKLQQDPSFTADGTEEYISRPFGNGSVGVLPVSTHYQGGFDLFIDAENIDVSFLMQGESAEHGTDAAASGIIGHIIDICESRKDCIACISPRYSDTLADKNAGNADATIAFLRTVRKSNYAFADSNFKYVSDKYNNKFRWVPFNGDTAGLMVKSELDRDAWFSPAGFNRGVYRGVVKTMTTQTKSDRDALYKDAINPVVNFSGQGTILFGDKTFTMRPSAFSRINVRRLFIVLEKSIATAAKFTLFEFNDEFTRAQFTSLIEPFLREIKGRRGIYDFRVIADSTNNTDAVIDANQFVGDIFIQPARSINFIQLNFVAVRTGVSFDEIVSAV